MTQTTAQPFLAPFEVLREHGLSAHTPLQILVHATATDPTLLGGTPSPYMSVGQLYHFWDGAVGEYEVCLRCRRGNPSLPSFHPDFVPARGLRDTRVVYWASPNRRTGGTIYMNIHLQCLTPPELAWLWSMGVVDSPRDTVWFYAPHELVDPGDGTG